MIKRRQKNKLQKQNVTKKTKNYSISLYCDVNTNRRKKSLTDDDDDDKGVPLTVNVLVDASLLSNVVTMGG